MNEFNQKLIERLQEELNRHLKSKVEFAEVFENSPAYAISTYGESMMVSSHVVTGFPAIIDIAKTSDEDEVRGMVSHYLQEADFALLASDFGHNSTSALKNIENMAQHEAYRRRRMIFREVMGLGTL